jgi:serine/threonine protein phosphatase PrpC
MVLKQIITSSGDKGTKQQAKAVLAPKINQDSFKVMKAFPQGTKQFNWLFAIFDGHGPHGEIMSQYAANYLPDYLNPELSKLGEQYTKKIQDM